MELKDLIQSRKKGKAYSVIPRQGVHRQQENWPGAFTLNRDSEYEIENGNTLKFWLQDDTSSKPLGLSVVILGSFDDMHNWNRHGNQSDYCLKLNGDFPLVGTNLKLYATNLIDLRYTWGANSPFPKPFLKGVHAVIYPCQPMDLNAFQESLQLLGWEICYDPSSMSILKLGSVEEKSSISDDDSKSGSFDDNPDSHGDNDNNPNRGEIKGLPSDLSFLSPAIDTNRHVDSDERFDSLFRVVCLVYKHSTDSMDMILLWNVASYLCDQFSLDTTFEEFMESSIAFYLFPIIVYFHLNKNSENYLLELVIEDMIPTFEKTKKHLILMFRDANYR